LGRQLRGEADDDVDFARAAYTWVRDQVAHSGDVGSPRVTLSAGEALRERTGLCYSKAHLVAALLRSQGVPAGLCYQRLRLGYDGFVLHGVVAVWLGGDWHRQDPRGNRPGLDAQFSLTGERLAWRARSEKGERDYADVFVTAAPVVVTALTAAARGGPLVLPTGLSPS
jgi:transglutaminase-like putative cysteine protease